MRVKIIALTIVSVVALFGLLATSSNPSSGQEQRSPTGRQTAHLIGGRDLPTPGSNATDVGRRGRQGDANSVMERLEFHLYAAISELNAA